MESLKKLIELLSSKGLGVLNNEIACAIRRKINNQNLGNFCRFCRAEIFDVSIIVFACDKQKLMAQPTALSTHVI